MQAHDTTHNEQCVNWVDKQKVFWSQSYYGPRVLYCLDHVLSQYCPSLCIYPFCSCVTVLTPSFPQGVWGTKRVNDEVEAMIADLQLLDKRNIPASKLSGGMKRKLR